MSTDQLIEALEVIQIDEPMPALEPMPVDRPIPTDEAMPANRPIPARQLESMPALEPMKAEQASECVPKVGGQSSQTSHIRPEPLIHQFARATTIDYGHGRVDIPILRASDLINCQLDWPYVGQVVTVRRIRINKATGEILSDQSHLLLTSLSPEEASASDLLDLCRGHWTIENKSHYVRDVTFSEDASQVRNGTLQKIMDAFRKSVICALRRLGVTSIKGSLCENSANPFTVFTYLAM